MSNLFLCAASGSTIVNMWETHRETIIFLGRKAMMIVLVVLLAWICIRFVISFIHRMVSKASWCDEASERAVNKLFRYAIGFLALLIVLDICGINTASLLTVLGAAGLAVGLALKDTLGNLASGLVLLFIRPYNIGDFIECGTISGAVKKMGFFTTVLTTPDGLYISVPNSAMWGSPIKNYSRNELRRADIVVGVSYSDDIEKGVAELQRLMAETKTIVNDPPPEVLIAELADSSVNLQLRFWSRTADYWTSYWAIKKSLKNVLEDAGLNIPFPQRVVTLVNTFESVVTKSEGNGNVLSTPVAVKRPSKSQQL